MVRPLSAPDGSPVSFELNGKYARVIDDGFVKRRKSTTNVMPANPGPVSGAGAGIHNYQTGTRALDPGIRRGDSFFGELNRPLCTHFVNDSDLQDCLGVFAPIMLWWPQ
jgi:hypothetical protein